MRGRLNEMFDDIMNINVNSKQFLSDLGMNNMPMNSMRTDIIDNKDHFLLKVDIPGFKKEDLEITIEDGYLTIAAEMSSESNVENANYIRRERYSGRQERKMRVDKSLTNKDIEASFKDGVLEIKIPKVEPVKTDKPKVEIK